jgi:hypothetical protein
MISLSISTASRGSAQQGACGGGVAGNGSSPLLVGESSLVRVRMAAEADPQMVFTSLAHRIDVFLYKALEVVYEHAERAWRRWLSRRSSKGVVLFEQLRSAHPLPKPRIIHNI